MKEKKQDTIYTFRYLWNIANKISKKENRSRNFIVEKVLIEGFKSLYPKEYNQEVK